MIDQITDQLKTCTKCKEIKSISEFCRRSNRKSGFNSVCRKCTRAYMNKYNIKWLPKYKANNRDKILLNLKNWRKKHENREYVINYGAKYRIVNKTELNKKDRDRHYRNKLRTIELLGGVCVKCGGKEIEFLTIDHINNDGAIERKTMHHKCLYSKIASGIQDITNYQILCRNCNGEKANKLLFFKDPISIHPFNGDSCKTCGRPKLTRTSYHLKYGTRKRSGCPYCQKQNNMILRSKVITLLGDHCACCGQTEIFKLNIDHVNNDGSLVRHMNKCGTSYFYRRLLDETLDRNLYQILCWNCNFSKYIGNGICIHKRKEVEEHV